MASREPTRYQLSSRLQYQSHVPAFLQKFHDKVKGIATEDDDEPQYYDDGSGRPPIPIRPAIPQRASDDPGSAEEDDDDEKPQVIVLKAGKHLTEREAENERRKEKGLSPLPTPGNESGKQGDKQPSKDAPKSRQTISSLSFSSSNGKPSKGSTKLKRRIITEEEGNGDESNKVKKTPKKKPKREGKSLLSFGEDV